MKDLQDVQFGRDSSLGSHSYSRTAQPTCPYHWQLAQSHDAMLSEEQVCLGRPITSRQCKAFRNDKRSSSATDKRACGGVLWISCPSTTMRCTGQFCESWLPKLVQKGSGCVSALGDTMDGEDALLAFKMRAPALGGRRLGASMFRGRIR